MTQKQATPQAKLMVEETLGEFGSNIVSFIKT
jgi:hypothetical protein